MAVLSTTDITFPDQMAKGIWQKAQQGSVIGNLVGAEPMKFGKVKKMLFTTPPRAEFVTAGAQKSGSSVAFTSKEAQPYKAQVTLRFDQEVQFADEDYQLEVLQTLADSSANALARALDLGIFHALNPLPGTTFAGITEKLSDTTASVTTNDKPDLEIETATGLVITNEYVPNGIALDPSYAWTLATQRDTVGRKLYPELQMTVAPSVFNGLKTSVSTTVSGKPEAQTVTKVKGFIGDWSALMWGVQRQIPIEKIEYGDPDGQGDLKRKNQIALRSEIVYGWAILDLTAFAKIVEPGV